MSPGNASSGAQIEISTFDAQNNTCAQNSDGAAESGKVTASISGRRDVTIKAIVFAVAKIDTLRNCSRAGGSGDLGIRIMFPCFNKLACGRGFAAEGSRAEFYGKTNLQNP